VATDIQICMGSSCFSRGNQHNLAVIREFLRERGIAANVVLRGGLCFGRCSRGPHLVIDGTHYEQVDPNLCLDLLRRHFQQETPG
jgi:NADH:ubiquinone oxidoreductase subunit E